MKNLIRLILTTFTVLFLPFLTAAQTNEFTYQGKLTDSGTASGTYDFEFRLCDSGSAIIPCNPALPTIQRLGVPVTNGIFTVTLNYDTAYFLLGADRYLQISVRRNSGEAWTQLSPRQKITSSPYSIKSLSATTADNSLQLGGLAANQYILTNDSRLTDDRNPLPNSPNYIQNTTSPQPTSNFNISGNGTSAGTLSGNIVNAATQFNIGGNRILSNNGFENLLIGNSAGAANSGSGNSFVGALSGQLNSSGSFNSFFGRYSGLNNTSGERNTFIGQQSGSLNTSGANNTFIGHQTGTLNTTGSNNTALGVGSGVNGNNLSFATAIGAGASVGGSNQIVLGRSGGQDEVRIPGNAVFSQDLTTNTFAANAVFTTQFQAGSINLETLGAAGGTQLCRNDSNQISNCSSSLRYKTNIVPFYFGLSFINRLRPISFDWKQGGRKDIGFGAEDVAQISPLFVTYNEKGEIEGVKYDRLSVVFVNAFQEQQKQIERQQKQIDELKQIVCSLKPEAEICRK